ncbi:uncharacterized protein [Procambarus clarkii]|uniref:uncharacterized protein isoform X1 n=1 Tax=Procambarus clarkii TaxID=6728 RepID=UPI0037434FFE
MDGYSPCAEDWNSTLCQDEGVGVDAGVDANTTVGVMASDGGRESRRGWQSIRQELQWAFPVHIYGFACLFFMLAFYTFFSILNLRSQISNRPFMSTINVFLCVLGVTRAACFLIDPYTLGQVMPGFLGSVMWDVGYPCILSAFSLIQLAFSQLTQVKFRPETLRRKSALSLVITTHFALVLVSDIVTAFESHLQVLRWAVQTVFLSWGLVLCVTFLYGGSRIIRLLRNIPHAAFQGGEPDAPNNKGILQLALLAQCNNIASSVLTAATPSLLAPKIKITDEFDHTYSYVSEGSRVPSLHYGDMDSAPTSRRPSSRASVGGDSAIASTSGMRVFEDETPDIAEESEDQESVTTSPTRPRRGSGLGSSPTEHSSCGSPSVEHSTWGAKSPKTHRPEEAKGKRKKSVHENNKSANIVIRVEEVGGGDGGGSEVPDDVSLGHERDDIAYIDKNEPEVNDREDWVNGVEVAVTNDANSEVGIKGIIHNVPSIKLIDSVLKSETPSEETAKNCGDARKGGFCEFKNVENDIKSVVKNDDSEQLKISNGEDLVPKRKKSLTWSEDTQTIESCDKDNESKKVAEQDTNERHFKDKPRRASTSSRRSSHRSSEKTKLRHTRSYELGGDAGGRRRSSTASCSSRKGNDSWQALPGPCHRDLRSLGSSSPSTTRRGSRKSVKDDAEVEALLARSPESRADVTLTSILNHIAYVNQTAAASKLPTTFKDSRKSQVQQVMLVTYVTAALGTLLSLALVYGLYGRFSSPMVVPRPPWLWFTYESTCRFLEFLMGCAMANITRQPVNRHPQYPYSLRLKQRNSLYI